MKYARVCDIGKVRSMNQDAVFAANKGHTGLFVVADGMGGHSRGERASRHIIKKIEEWWENFCPEHYDDDFKMIMRAVQKVAEQANREIYQNYNRNDICGSTMVLLLIYKEVYGLLYAGDSRIYLYHRRKLRQLTMDEVWENQSGLTLAEKEARWERCHGKLYNAVGISGTMQCNITTNELKPGMVFLLCSDGLYKYCSEKYLKKCLKKVGKESIPEIITGAMLEKVYEQGAGDNVSIIVVCDIG